MKNIVFIIKIAFDIPISNTFLYLYNLKKPPIIGGRVITNFRNKKIIGIILSYKIYKNKKVSFKLKYVYYMIDKVSIFKSCIWKTILKCSKYYECSINFIIFFNIPGFLKNMKIFKFKSKHSLSITDYGKNLNLKSIKMCKKQVFVIKLLKKIRLYMNNLGKNNFSIYTSNIFKNKNIYKKKNILNNFLFKNFNLVKKKCLNKKKNIENKSEKVIKNLKKFKVWLITSSLFYEKMKFYISLFKKVLKNNLKILLVVSDFYLLNKFKREIEKEISISIYIYHSNMTEIQKLFCWKMFNKKYPAIIISTKVGMFVPIVNLGILILDEESSSYYRVLRKWFFNVRNVVLIRAYYEKIPIVLESSEPSLNTLYNVYKKKINKINISNKIINYYKNFKKFLIDMNNERFRGVFSISLINKVNMFLKKKNNICIIADSISYIFFFIKCHSCKSILKCNICNQICEFKLYEQKIFCRFCFFDKKKYFNCLKCGSKNFYYKKCNISFLIKNIKEVFPNIPIFFLEKKNTINYISSNSKSIFLIKSKNMFKYDLKNINLLVFFYIDNYFNFPYFKYVEIFSQKYYNMIRLFLDSFNFSLTIVLQTKLYKNNLFNKFFYNGYMFFSKYLLHVRKKYNLPPFNAHAIIRLESKNKKKTFILLKSAIFFLKKSYFCNTKDFFFISYNNIYFNKYNNSFYSKILLSHSSKLFLRIVFRKLCKYIKDFLCIKNINIIFDIDTVQKF